MSKRPHLFIWMILFGFAFFPGQTHGQAPDLRTRLLRYVARKPAQVGIAVKHLENGDTLSVAAGFPYPMQSVYKFPLAIAVMHQVEAGKLSLDRKKRVTADHVREETWSQIRLKYPKGGVDLTVGELLFYAVSWSDNIACDLLFEVMGGTAPVNQYVRSLGFNRIQVVSTERELHHDWNAQYRNWCDPVQMNTLLVNFKNGMYLSDSGTRFLYNLMLDSRNSAMRIRGMLPDEVVVAHKTGTNGNDTVVSACNDIGIITLPDGNHLAVSVFVSGLRGSFEEAEQIIAEATRLIYDQYSGKETFHFEKGNLISKDRKDTLPYRLYSPEIRDTGTRYPLLIYLHGMGLRGTDNVRPLAKLSPAFTDTALRRKFPCYILVPQCPPQDEWAHFVDFPNSLATTEQPTRASEMLLNLIVKIVTTRKVEMTRIYLTGYSMGGEGTYDLLSREPGLFACAAPLAAVGDTARAGVMKNVPIWAFHGEDDTVNDIRYGRMMVMAINKRRGRAFFTSFPKVGHDCRNEVYANPDFWTWMFAQKRMR